MKKFKISFYFFLVSIFVAMLSQNARGDYKPLEGSSTVSKKSRLGDRFYIQSVFSEIFGPESIPVTEKFIFTQAASFGGPCDVYEQVRIGVNADSLADRHSICTGGSLAANLPMTGVSNVMRQGFVIRTCGLLTKDEKTLGFALGRIFLKEEVKAPNRENLLTSFRLFNPERTPSSEVLEALNKIGTHEREIKKRWSLILYTLCIDPAWQII